MLQRGGRRGHVAWGWWVVFFAILGIPQPAAAGVDRWTPTGPAGGWVVSLQVDPQDPETLYAGTLTLGTFKTTDRGESWIWLNESFRDLGQVLAIDPRDASVLYGNVSQGLVRSPDGGATWEPLGQGLPRPPISLVLDPFDPAIYYAGLFSEGVFKSLDGGATWSPINNGLVELDASALALDPSDPSILYYGSSAGLAKTIDGGAQWQDSGSGLTGPVQEIHIDPSDTSILFVLVDDQGIFKSVDGGQSWQASSLGLPASDIESFCLDPADPRILYAAGLSEIFRSLDGGGGWAAVGSYAIDELRPSRLLCASHRSDALYLGSFGGPGVVRSDDRGLSWAAANHNMKTQSVGRLEVATADPLTLYGIVTGVGLGVGVSRDGGQSWSKRGGPSGDVGRSLRVLALDPTDSSTIYGGTLAEGVFKSTDGGRTWADAASGITDGEILSLAVEPRHGRIVLAGTEGGKIFESRDAGATWVDRSAGLLGHRVTALLFDPEVPDRTWAATWDGLFTRRGVEPWSRILDEALAKVVSAPSEPRRRYAAAVNGTLYKSVDGGGTWTSAAIPNGFLVSQIVVDPFDSDRILVGAFHPGIQLSEDAGVSWRLLNETLLPWALLEDLKAAPTTPPTYYTAVSEGTLFQLMLAQPPAITANKRVTGNLHPGGTVVYTLTLTNEGDDEQPDNPGPELVDVLPPELLLQDAHVVAGGGSIEVDAGSNTVTWNGSIPGKGSVTFRIEATILPGVEPGREITNQAEAFFDRDGDGINEATAASIDPSTGGATTFFVTAAIPALGLLGIVLLTLLLALAGLRRVAGTT